jgi:hypothetical protein
MTGLRKLDPKRGAALASGASWSNDNGVIKSISL